MKQKSISFVLTILLSIFALMGCEDEGVITHMGDPLEGVTVKLLQPLPPPDNVIETTTDANGLYAFEESHFDEDGVYVAKVWLDISPGIFKNGKMYTRESDEETGYRVYKRYQVIWSDQE